MKKKNFVVPPSKPRTALVAAVMTRTGSGSHRKSETTHRQAAKLALRAERF
ncbi:hypothetical protein [Paraburkholderia sp. GAS32]|uniref:hypothetical protein n=1 Tax=Paraburkholderia sp. GAS32 TaxID=3035129 RepID=UPI003D1C638A